MLQLKLSLSLVFTLLVYVPYHTCFWLPRQILEKWGWIWAQDMQGLWNEENLHGSKNNLKLKNFFKKERKPEKEVEELIMRVYIILLFWYYPLLYQALITLLGLFHFFCQWWYFAFSSDKNWLVCKKRNNGNDYRQS